MRQNLSTHIDVLNLHGGAKLTLPYDGRIYILSRVRILEHDVGDMNSSASLEIETVATAEHLQAEPKSRSEHLAHQIPTRARLWVYKGSLSTATWAHYAEVG